MPLYARIVALFCTLATSAAWAQGSAPHAWLYGTWTGGLFPVSGPMTVQACLAQPTVIFSRDVVLRATLSDVVFAQRVVETARSGPDGTDFRFTPGVDPVAATSRGLLGLEAPNPTPGFGCESPDGLHVERRSENEIAFPGCADFPYPLARCVPR